MNNLEEQYRAVMCEELLNVKNNTVLTEDALELQSRSSSQ